jgi:hypothetical protein
MFFKSIFAACLLLAFAQAHSEASLRIAWPDGWEIRPPTTQGSTLQLQARHRAGDQTSLLLHVIAVNVEAAARPIDAAAVKGLASQLRDAALRKSTEASIELVAFGKSQGYYFAATHRGGRHSDDEFRQAVEGVLLRSGYLINFTLHTDDVASADTKALLSALAELRID